MQARFPGQCAACGRRFPAGTHIRPAFGKGWQHSRCPSTDPKPEAAPEVRPYIPIPQVPCCFCEIELDGDGVVTKRGWAHRSCLAQHLEWEAANR